MKISIFKCLKCTSSAAGYSHIYKQGVVVFGCSLLCLSGGLTIGISAVLLPQLVTDQEFHWETGYGSWMAATAPISSILGCLTIGTILDSFGRKWANVLLTLPFIAGWLSMAFAENFYTMIIGRFLTGFGLGAARPSAITYIGEISNPKYRGIMLLFTSLALNLGVLFSHVLGTFLHWRTALYICVVPNFVLIVLLFFFKESPFWLITKGRIEEGVNSFRWFRGNGDAAENELKVIIEKQKGKGLKLTFQELVCILFSSRFIKPTVTILFVFVTVHLNGVNAFPFYANDMLKSIFDDEVDTFLLTMIIDAIRVFISVIVCIFGKTMRRKLTFVSCAFATTLVLICLIIYLIYKSECISVSIPIILIVIYTGLASTIISLGWTFVPELFTTNVRGLGSGLSGAISGCFLSVCVKITPILLAYRNHVLFGTFAGITVLGAVVLSFILPETRGKRLQDIEDSYNNKRKEVITPL